MISVLSAIKKTTYRFWEGHTIDLYHPYTQNGPFISEFQLIFTDAS